MARARAVLALPLLALAGCGSLRDDQLPPAATPVASPPLAAAPDGRVFETDVRLREALTEGVDPEDVPTLARPPALTATANDGATTLRLFPRTRELTASGRTTGTVGAGVGPAGVASDGAGTAYVTDAGTDGIVVVRTRPTLAVTRRVGLPGGAPWAIVYDRERRRLWVTLTATNQLVELAAGPRPRELRRYATVRSPEGVRVERDGDVLVYGRGAFQRVVPRG